MFLGVATGMIRTLLRKRTPMQTPNGVFLGGIEWNSQYVPFVQKQACYVLVASEN